MVECQLPKLNVAGSIPVTRSTFSVPDDDTSESNVSTQPGPVRRLVCPSCRKRFDQSTSDHPPFCSERCKLLDLGNWLDENYRIAGDPAPDAAEDSDLD